MFGVHNSRLLCQSVTVCHAIDSLGPQVARRPWSSGAQAPSSFTDLRKDFSLCAATQKRLGNTALRDNKHLQEKIILC